MKTREEKWADVEALLPGLRNVWKKLRAQHEIRTRAPRVVTFTDEPVQAAPWNDSYVGRLHRLDLETMDVSSSNLCSTYDVALYVPDGMVGDTRPVNGRVAVIKLEWNDHYRHVAMTIQLPKQPEAVAELT